MINELMCFSAVIVNMAGGWTDLDRQNYEQAKIRCESLYGTSAPCLVRFIKKEDGVYNAICGPMGKIGWNEHLK